jgi:uncharacterized membrane protein
MASRAPAVSAEQHDVRGDRPHVPADRTGHDPTGGARRRGRRTLRGRPRRRPFRYTLPGLTGALVLLCVSLTPSLLPRTGLSQGLVSGTTAAFGYGVGVVAAGAWRAVVDRTPDRPGAGRGWSSAGSRWSPPSRPPPTAATGRRASGS